MNLLKYPLLLLPLLLFTAQASAGQQEEANVHIEQLLERTGFNKLLDRVPDFAQGVLKQSAGALDPEVNAAVSGVFQRAFSRTNVRRDVVRTLRAHHNREQAQAYLNILDSPLALKMAKLERAPNQAENRSAFQAYVHQLKSEPAPAPRLALIERLDQANRTTQFSVDMQTAFFKAVFSAVDPIMDPEMRLGDGELEKMVGEIRESLGKDIRNRTQASYLFAFRDISDNELEEYVRLCESEPHRWAIQLLGNAMISALNQAGERSALLMAEAAE